MNNKDKSLNLLGLATRAGKLKSGQPIVLDAIRKKQAKRVILAIDAGVDTQKQITNKCDSFGVPLTKAFTKREISQAIGKDRSVCCFTDQGFAKSFLKLQ